MGKIEKLEYRYVCVKCDEKLLHPPVKIPIEVWKSELPFTYDIEYSMACQKCAVELLTPRLFGFRKPVMDLKWLNPTGQDRWEKNDIITHKEEQE